MCKYCDLNVEDKDNILIGHLHDEHSEQFDNFTANRIEQLLFYLKKANQTIRQQEREISVLKRNLNIAKFDL